MPNEVDGDQFVRQLAGNVRDSGTAYLETARALVSRLDEQPGGRLAAANTGNPSSSTIAPSRPDNGIKSDLAAGTAALGSYFTTAIGFGATRKERVRPGGGVAENSSSSTFSLDPYHLEFLDTIFRKSSVVNEYVADSELNGHLPNIMPSPSTGMKASNSSTYLSNLWSRAGGRGDTPQPPATTFDEDVLYLYKFFAALPALRIAPIRRNLIKSFEPTGESKVSLVPFHELVVIEFDAVHPRVIHDWGGARDRLRSLSCRYALKDAEDLIKDTTSHNENQDPDVPVPDDETGSVLYPLLTHLHLSGNSLTTLPSQLAAHIPRCTYLNLSSNALTAVPASLSSLSDLSVIDLTGNRITSISDAEDELRNVTVLLLQSNALENLLGVESLARLKCLDVSENKIWDVYEIGRLAVLMDVNEIWISDNPLTKLPNCRINIFTYFKERALNLRLDGTRPTASEQRAIQANMTVAASPAADTADHHASKPKKGPRSSASRDASVRNDRKSVTSGQRSVISGGTANKEERRRRRKNSAAVTTEPPIDEVVPVPSDPPSHPPSDIVTPKDVSQPGSPGVQRRMQRLAELERTVGATGATHSDQVDSADLIVSRAAKKTGKTKVKKPKVAAKTKKSEAIVPDTATDSQATTSAPVSGTVSPQVIPIPASQATPPTGTPPMPSRIPQDGIRDSTSSAVGSQQDLGEAPKPQKTIGRESIKADSDEFLLKSSREQLERPPLPPQAERPTSPPPEVVKEKTPQAPHVPIPPPPPLQPVPTVGKHIGNIGPYRRIFQFDNTGSDAASARSSSSNVHWVLPHGTGTGDAKPSPNMPRVRPFVARRTSSSGPDVEIGGRNDFAGVPSPQAGSRETLATNGVPRPGDQRLVAPLPALWFGKRGTPDTSRSASPAVNGTATPPTAPPLILAPPLRTYRGGGAGTASISTRSGGRSADTAPAYTTRRPPASETASVAGSGITWASMPSWMVPNRQGAGAQLVQVPSAPTLPFLTLTNALKLYLMLHVLKDQDSETCLCWLPASCTVQLPSSDPKNSGGGGGGLIGGWFQSAEREQSAWRSTDYLPAQKPCYVLLTTRRMYIFEPRFRFPFAGGRHDAASDTRYDSDIASLVRLVRSVRLSALGRVDVGPNRQYIVVRHHVSGATATAAASGPATGGINPLSAGGLSPAVDVVKGGRWESIVVLTRDRSATTAFLDGLAAFQRGRGGFQIVNEEATWAVTDLSDRVLVREGAKGDMGMPTSWAIEPARVAAPPSVSGKWYERLLRGSSSSSGGTTTTSGSEGKSTGVQNKLDARMAATLLSLDAKDLALADADLLKTYLLVGLIVTPPASSTTTVKTHHHPSISVRPLSLLATDSYLYLFTERHDVWPPLLFPPERTGVPSWANDAITRRHPSDASKGMLADAVGLVSHVVDVGSVALVTRCERWRTWRFGGGEGGVVQNGYLGAWRRGRRREREASGVVSGEWGVGREGECVEGNAGGWSWWVRVVFGGTSTVESGPARAADTIAAAVATPEDGAPPAPLSGSGATPTMESDASRDVVSSNQDAQIGSEPSSEPAPSSFLAPPPAMATPSRPPTGTEPLAHDERHWDLVFGSLDGANQFLDLLRRVRGERSEEGVEMDDSADEGQESANGATKSGIVFLIGDD
ncbi:hypothetical protein HKX48_000404 [Thoreauomyces humboldtii]|nr:hypothetical protein HKX48_000404 [Thoreauomyces humboldtii]